MKLCLKTGKVGTPGRLHPHDIKSPDQQLSKIILGKPCVYFYPQKSELPEEAAEVYVVDGSILIFFSDGYARLNEVS